MYKALLDWKVFDYKDVRWDSVRYMPRIEASSLPFRMGASVYVSICLDSRLPSSSPFGSEMWTVNLNRSSIELGSDSHHRGSTTHGRDGVWWGLRLDIKVLWIKEKLYEQTDTISRWAVKIGRMGWLGSVLVGKFSNFRYWRVDGCRLSLKVASWVNRRNVKCLHFLSIWIDGGGMDSTQVDTWWKKEDTGSTWCNRIKVKW